MSALDELHTQLITYNETLDRVTDKIAETNDKQVKTVLIKQHEELKKLKAGVEIQIKELEEVKSKTIH